MKLTYGMLKDQTGKKGPKTILLCMDCGNKCSANAGDYWDRPSNRFISCECGGEFEEGYFQTKFIVIERKDR